MKYLLLVGLLSAVAGQPASAQKGHRPAQPARPAQYPHFRPAEKRKLAHYKPKTWRERAPAPKLPQPASGPAH